MDKDEDNYDGYGDKTTTMINMINDNYGDDNDDEIDK